MILHKLTSEKDRIKDFPYQLTHWQPTKEKLQCYIDDFVRYDDVKYGRIAECAGKFAIFTKGERTTRKEIKK